MKPIRIYSYYSRSHRAWAHIKAYTKHEALEKARVYDPYTKFSDLSLLMQNCCYVLYSIIFLAFFNSLTKI